MYRSPSHLPQEARATIAASLNERLADGIDLFTQLKVAHWNVKGPHFASLHPLFESIADAIAGFNDEIAERAVTLGALARGTARHVAQNSHLPEYPQETTRDLDHVRLLAERITKYLQGVRTTRKVAEENGDTDTVDMLTEVVSAFEKHGWFLLATLEG